MYFLLLLVSFAATTLSLFLRQETRNGPYTALRLSFVQTLILHGLLMFCYNEVFSYLDLITPLTARLYWFVVALATCVWLARSVGGKAGLQRLLYRITTVVKVNNVDQRSRFLLYTGLIVMMLPLLALAVYAPPNNYDSNHYHLNRILYWLSNHNLDHYPTMHVQQLYHNVFGEYLVLHTFLLTGSDQLANFIQFGAMIGSITAVSLLAKRLGLPYRGQLLAGALMACLPIGILESTTTQVDYIACFFFISFVLFGFWFINQPNRLTLAWCLLALVFGSFTKYPVLFFALPYALYFAFRIISRQGFRFGLVTLLGAILFYGVVFGPFFSRNYRLFGSILSPQAPSRLMDEKIPVDKFSVAYSVSNLVKNAGLHISVPYLPYNLKAESAVVQFHRLLGVSIEEPAISKDRFHVRFSMEEDSAPNTIHFFLLLIALLILFSRRGHLSAKLLFGLALAGLVLYSSVFKFQWFSSRIHMQFFAIGCIITAYVYGAILKRSGFYLALLLGGLSMAVVLGNPAKMVVPLRYVAKRVLAHIPRHLGVDTPTQQQRFLQAVGTYYEPVPSPICPLCLSLRQSYSYSERAEIFRKLDSMNYFRHDKEESILFESRTQAYFASHTADYDAYAPLLTHIGSDVQNVGFMPTNNTGFYHFWSALNQQTKHLIRMAYVRYPREYVNLPNARQPFCYNYILSDDKELIGRLLKTADIADLYTSGKLTLVRLKRSTCQTYLF